MKYFYTITWDELAIKIEGQNLAESLARVEIRKLGFDQYILRVPINDRLFLKEEHKTCFHDYEPLFKKYESSWELLKETLALLEVVNG
jgi:hypothetical protein